MGKHYDYVIAVSMRLRMKDNAPNSLDDLKDFLQEQYPISATHSNRVKAALGFDPAELDDESEEDELSALLDLQVTFAESQMDGDEPTDEALDELRDEVTAYLESKYEVDCLELLDDAFSSHLLAEWEDDD